MSEHDKRYEIVMLWVPVAAATLFLLIFGAFRVHTYFTGEKLTARVTHCDTRVSYSRGGNTESTTCYGRWTTADGQRHTGEIGDAGSSDEGRNIPIRASGDEAIVDSPLQLWPIPFALIAPLGFGVYGIVRLVARRRQPRTPPGRVSEGLPAAR